MTNDTSILIRSVFLTLEAVLCMYFYKPGRQVEMLDFRAFGYWVITADAGR